MSAQGERQHAGVAPVRGFRFDEAEADGAGLEWQKSGLDEPQIILAATDAHRAACGTLGEFIDACCIIDATANMSGGRLYTAARRRWSEAWALVSGVQTQKQEAV